MKEYLELKEKINKIIYITFLNDLMASLQVLMGLRVLGLLVVFCRYSFCYKKKNQFNIKIFKFNQWEKNYKSYFMRIY